MRRSLSLILILAGASLATPSTAQPGPRGLFVSPAGEPFRRGDAAPQPMRAWFAQADSDRDGALGWAEFEADFLRWFAVLDADRDGEIEPDEVAVYEHRILPEMQSRVGPGGSGMRMMRGGGGRRELQRGGGRGGPGMGRLALMAGAAPFGLLPIAHPVMDADLDFNRGVTREEFSRAAARRFAMLNTQNNGRLTLEQLMAARAQAFRSGSRDSPGLGREAPAPPADEEEESP
jgi:hypothetical protein